MLRFFSFFDAVFVISLFFFFHLQIPGILILSNYRLFFALYSDALEEDQKAVVARHPSTPRRSHRLRNSLRVHHLQRRQSAGGPKTSAGVSVALMSLSRLKTKKKVLELLTEDLQAFAISFQHCHTRKIEVVAKTIESFAYNVSTAFAFYYKIPDLSPDKKWSFDAFSEFQRQGVGDNSAWRISLANKNYELCPTYPGVLAVPTSISDYELQEIANHRSKRRIPVLSWYHKERVALLRASQPLVLASGRHDSAYLDKIARIGMGKAARLKNWATRSTSLLNVFDARPRLNAVANAAAGRGGWETKNTYGNSISVCFLDIQNIHIVRTSFGKLKGLHCAADLKMRRRGSIARTHDRAVSMEISRARNTSHIFNENTKPVYRPKEAKMIRHCLVEAVLRLGGGGDLSDEDEELRKDAQALFASMGKGQSCDWFKHLETILHGSERVVSALTGSPTTEPNPVLVHCSDGWDRTSQLTSLSMLCLDPYYRTIYGFEVLIEKEWCSFGHKFAQRLGHRGDIGVGDEDDDEDEMPPPQTDSRKGSLIPGKLRAATAEDSKDRKNYKDKQRSPVFAQFLDCVYQLTRQFPNAFEFNESLLAHILHHSYTCRFGTFMEDNERERTEKKIFQRTFSLWDEVNSSIDLYKNTAYEEAPQENERLPLYHRSHVLKPSWQAGMLRLWDVYGSRWWWQGSSDDVQGDPDSAMKHASTFPGRQAVLAAPPSAKTDDDVSLAKERLLEASRKLKKKRTTGAI